ncbi:hypothetical protein D3C72_2283140 [compost metagenome]
MDADGRAADEEEGPVGLPELGREGLGLGDGAFRRVQGVEAVQFGEIEAGGGGQPWGDGGIEPEAAFVAGDVKGDGFLVEVTQQGREQGSGLRRGQDWISPST